MARYHIYNFSLTKLHPVVDVLDDPCTDVDCPLDHFTPPDPRPADVDPADTVREVTG